MSVAGDLNMNMEFMLTPVLNVQAINIILRALKQGLGDFGKDVRMIDAEKVNADIRKVTEGTAKLGQGFDEAKRKGDGVAESGQRMGRAFAFNQMVSAVQTVTQSLGELLGVGRDFEDNLKAVGAITGFTGDRLDDLATRARGLALAFGGSASDQLKSFQGILSKLGPQVAEDGAALSKFAVNVNILSAASGDDATTSMNALVDTMLQLGLVTGDSAKDAATSTRVINALAASAQVGAAEIPQVAASMLQVGVAAKGANLSLESTNAAIQVLAVGGKTGSEAGVALRNVLGLLQKASGPAADAMKSLGTSSDELGQLLTTQGLDAALKKINAGMDGLGSRAEKNAALMTIFGTENSAAAGILLDNVGKFKEFEEGIRAGEEGTGAAFDQAATRMDTDSTRISQTLAVIKDGFLTVFGALGSGFTTLVGVGTQIGPLVSGLAGLSQVLPEGAFTKFSGVITSTVLPAIGRLIGLKTVLAADSLREAVAETVSTTAKQAAAAASVESASAAVAEAIAKEAAALAAIEVAIAETEQAIAMEAAGVVSAEEAATLVANATAKEAAALAAQALALAEIEVVIATEAAAVAELESSVGATANAIAMEAEAVAASEAAGSMGVLNLIMSLNPVFLIATGIGLLVGAFLIFSHKTKELGDATKDATKAMDDFNTATTQASAVEKHAQKLGDLADKYDRLKDSTDPAKQKEFADAARDLAKELPNTADKFDKLNESGVLVGQTISIDTQAVRDFITEQRNLAAAAKEDATASLIDNTQALAESYHKAREEQVSLRDDKKFLDEALKGDHGIGGAVQNIFGQPKEDIAKINAKLAEQNDILDKATPEIKKQIEGFKDMGLSVDQIAERTHFTVKEVKAFGGALDLTAIHAQGIDTALKGVGDTQAKNIRQVADQAAEFQSAQAEVDKLNAAIAQQKTLGLDTKELDKQLADAVDTAKDKQIVLNASIESKGGADLFKGISDEAKSQLGLLPSIVQDSLQSAKDKAVEANLGKALGDSAKIKEAIDENNELGKWIEQYDSAKTQVEKDDLAAKIAAKTPSAIAGYDKVTGAVQISIDKAKLFKESQDSVFSPELASKQKDYTEGLKAQADTLAENTDRAAELQQAIVDGVSHKKDVSALQAEYATLQVKIKANTDSLATTIVQGKKFALIKGDIKKIGDEFNLSAKQGSGVSKAVQQIEHDSVLAAKQVANLADEFNKVKAAADKTVQDAKANIALALFKFQQGLIDEQQKDKIIEFYRTVGRAAAGDAKQLAAFEKQAEQILGIAAKDPGKAPREKRHGDEKSIYETLRAQFDVKQKILQAEARQEKITRDTKIAEDGRSANDVEKLEAEQKKLEALQKELDALRLIFKISGEGADIKIGANLKAEDVPKLKDDLASLVSSIDEQKIAVITARLVLDPKFDDDKLADQTEKRLKADMELGKSSLKEFEVFLVTETERLRGRLATETQKLLDELNDRKAKGLIKDEATYQAQLTLITTAQDARLFQLAERLTLKEKELRDLRYANDLEALLFAQKRRREAMEDDIEQWLKIMQRLEATNTRVQNFEIEKRYKIQQQMLDDQKAHLLITEEEHARESALIEENAAKDKEVLQTRLNASAREAQRQVEVRKLEEQQQSVREQLAAAVKAGNAKDVDKFSTILDDLAVKIAEKGNLIASVTDDLRDNITDAFTNLFDGQEAALKEPFRKVLATLGGALSALASAKITEVLLSSIGPFGLPGLFVTLALRPFITSSINALIQPLLNQITRFGTGGRVDSPTLAVVGDAASFGGRNTEWIFRDEQLMSLVRWVLASYQGPMLLAIQNLQGAVEGLDGRFYVTEEDITNGVNRENRRRDQRVRGR